MQKNNPFDSRALLAIGVVIVFYIGYQKYLSNKYGTNKLTPAVTTSDTATPAPTAETPAALPGGTTKTTNTAIAPAIPESPAETFTSFENQNIAVKVSNKGLGLTEVDLKKFINREEKLVRVSQGEMSGLYELRIDGRAVYFNTNKESENRLVGTFENGDYKIVRTLNFTDGYNVQSEVKINAKSDKIPKVSIVISEKIHHAEKKSWLFPSYDHQDFNIVDGKTSHLVNFSNASSNVTQDFNPVTVAGISSQYFTTSFLDQSSLLPSAHVQSDVATGNAVLELKYEPPQFTQEYSFSQILFMGPKLINELGAVDPKLSQVVDFGMLGWLARPMLNIMKVFHDWTLNWGVAIILLTLLVRLIVLPFNVISYRSMKAMQKIQPLITELRERNKADPMALNKEMMALMKTHKANPLSGCLPMLLQIPVFFALFRVIGSSVELYRSPFYLWITDLSVRDPFFVLPVIMGITMFIQQKLTPTNMDPTQAKILAFLPLIFTVFMLNLPSGLTLYMCVSAIFGITQQWFMLKKSKA